MIKVLIVDDSPTVREFLSQVLSAAPGLRLVGAVKDGAEALEFLKRGRPDVITMDIEMPGMDGFETTRKIMETSPVPVVIVSGISLAEQRATFRAVEAGAVAVVSRPRGAGHPNHQDSVRELTDTIRAMAEVKVVRRWPKTREREAKALPAVPGPGEVGIPKIVGIGASTGGPAAVKAVLSGLPADLPFPIVLVQHMTRGFTQGFADWLGAASGRCVQLGSQNARMEPGCVYVAPEAFQMGVNAEARIVLTRPDEIPPHSPCPSVSWLLRSLADSYGPAAVGVLLTGMGKDGADGLRMMRDRGGITIVQSAESCIVNGMPDAAVRLAAAAYVLPPDRISGMLKRLASGLS